MPIKPSLRKALIHPRDPDYDPDYDYEKELNRYEMEIEMEEDDRRGEQNKSQS